MNDRSEIVWAPRVTLAKVHELYVNEARGACTDELIEEVGFGLFARCEGILEFTEACAGLVKCKRCANAGATRLIERKSRLPAEFLRCPVCGWQVRWRVYMVESEKTDGQLHAGNAGAAFRRYVAKYPQCQTREEKIVAIDRLIHEFHWITVNEARAATPHKPAGVNLLRGTTSQVIEMLHSLTYGDNPPAELVENLEWWREQRPIKRRLDSKVE